MVDIICTVGPATSKRSMIRLLECAGVTMFRLNLSHTDCLDEVDRFAEMIATETKGKFCLDTHGIKFRAPDAPPFTPFDEEALRRGAKLKVGYVALSFTHNKATIRRARELGGNGVQVIAKIEDKVGVENREEIIAEADAILIDRGDLSKSIFIEEVPHCCTDIIRLSKKAQTPIWVATNLLESMVRHPSPTLAEVNDIACLIGQGVDGLVLAAETAIGKYPIQCVEFVRRMTERYERQ